MYDMREELEIMQGKKKDHRVGLVVDGYYVTRGRWGSSWNAHAVYGSSMASSPEIRRPRTELSTVRQARIDGLHPYQRQSHRVRFDLLERRPLQTTSVFVVQIDTALFAYEPVLKAIEDIKDMPLRADFLG